MYCRLTLVSVSMEVIDTGSHTYLDQHSIFANSVFFFLALRMIVGKQTKQPSGSYCQFLYVIPHKTPSSLHAYISRYSCVIHPGSHGYLYMHSFMNHLLAIALLNYPNFKKNILHIRYVGRIIVLYLGEH